MDYQSSKAWPYVEARKIAERNITGRSVVFETGFGPTNRPHLGTHGECARTTMVRRAYEDLMGYGRNTHTRLICFSDDMDALRSVAPNLPNQEMMQEHIGISLSQVPDPFGTHESFAHHNNAMLREFLDRFGFDYEFMSSTEQYQSGRFDDTLRLFGRHYDDVRDVILPTLGPDRRATYSPFMPINPDTGRVYDTGVMVVNGDGEMTVDHPDYGPTDCLYTSGGAKLGWRSDWAMRWIALGVDYEMAGKDLIDSVKLSSAIVRKLGHTPPVNMIYEMFLDEQGQKISKSKGNGLTMEEWLTYGTPESLSAYLYREPNRAKKLYPAVVVQAMTDYHDARSKYADQTNEQKLGNPVHHVHDGNVPTVTLPVSYPLLLNIAGTASIEDAETLLGYVEKAYPDVDVTDEMHTMIGLATNYHMDHRRGHLDYRVATVEEGRAFNDLASRISLISGNVLEYQHGDSDGAVFMQPVSYTAVPAWAVNIKTKTVEDQIQFEVYEVGKSRYGKENLRDWFKAIYQCLLGQDSGPRFGAFAVLFGVTETIALLREHAAAASDEEIV